MNYDFLKQLVQNFQSMSEEEKAIWRKKVEQRLKEEREEHIKYIKIKLDSGREVTVEKFSLENTYGGIIFDCGGPDDENLNNSIFEKAKSPSWWGSNKMIKIRPSDKEFQEGFKPYRYTVSLSSAPLNPIFCASELVVIWFDYNPIGATIESIIQNGISTIDWEANAQDFDY